MTRHIAFLRAINVGGHTVAMQALRKEFEALGFASVETFIASGNVIFETRARDSAALERKIERRLLATLGFEVSTFLRTDAEVAAIAAREPFGSGVPRQGGALNIGFVRSPLDRRQRAALGSLETAIDRFHVHGREVYWACTGKQGESKFSNAVLEKKLGIRATLRGVNTVRKLADRYRST
jgi:uncharacterized protein (DUF1697 family)